MDEHRYHDTEQIDVPQRRDMFGDLYEWNRLSVPNYHITSLLINNDLDFTSADLSVICQLTPLRQLFLHNLRNLDSLPPKLAKLTHLRVLSVTHCDSLTELSLAVRCLHNLETLRLNCPTITHLPLFLCLMSSLSLLLLQKSIAICVQCKNHIRKSPRFIIMFEEDHQINTATSVLPLTILSANAHLSTLTSSFYSALPVKMLWPFFEEALSLPQSCQCSMCSSLCTQRRHVTINCTRVFNCKCVHMHGYICSETCKENLLRHLSFVCPSADIILMSQSPLTRSVSEYSAPLSHSIWRRVKRTISHWSSCIPHYHKKSYTVTAA